MCVLCLLRKGSSWNLLDNFTLRPLALSASDRGVLKISIILLILLLLVMLFMIAFSLLHFFFAFFSPLFSNFLLKRCKGGSGCLVPNSCSDGKKPSNFWHTCTFWKWRNRFSPSCTLLLCLREVQKFVKGWWVLILHLSPLRFWPFLNGRMEYRSNERQGDREGEAEHRQLL